MGGAKNPKSGPGRQSGGSREPEAAAIRWMASPRVAIGAIAAGILFCLVCGRGDLWLDEVLSLQWGKNSKSLADLIGLYRHDNNHILNSAWLMLVGEAAHPLIQRALAILSGGASLILLWRLGRLFSPAASAIPVILATSSFPFILYASEARGYAPAIALTLGCLALLPGRAEGRGFPSPLRLFVFHLVSILAILAHATAIYPLAAMGLWQLVRTRFRGFREVLSAAGRATAWFAPSAVFAIWFYFCFLKEMMIAGGPQTGLIEVAGEFFAFGLGLPLPGQAGMIEMLIGSVILAAAMLFGKWADPEHRSFFLMIIATAAASAFIANRSEYVAFRYFIVFLPFLLLLIGILWERLMADWPRFATPAGVALLAFYLAGQLPRIADLVRHGRGGYSEAMRFMAEARTPGRTISADHEMAGGMLVAFFQRRDPALQSLTYVSASAVEAGREKPSWIILTSQGRQNPAGRADVQIGTGAYQFRRYYPSAPVSGFNWAVYSLITPSQTHEHTR